MRARKGAPRPVAAAHGEAQKAMALPNGAGRGAGRCVALAAALAILAGSCATGLVLASSVDPLELLAPGELAYVRMNAGTARLLAPSLLPAGEGQALAPLLDRTSSVALGLGVPAEGRPPFDAVFLGSYPFRSAAIALGGTKGWKREGSGFSNAKEGIKVAIPGPRLVLATTGSLDEALARARMPGGNPLPPRFSAAAESDLLVWIPEPFSGLARTLYGLSMDVPAEGLLLRATRGPGAAGPDYSLTATFLMRDADAARVYRPVLRLAWYGLSHYLLGDEAQLLLAATFSLEGDSYTSSEVDLPAGQLAAALSRIGGFESGPAD